MDARRAALDSGPLRIALMLETDGPGGAETVVWQLARELRRRGHEVLPVGPAPGDGWLATRLTEAGFAPATYHIRRPIDRQCVAQIASLLREHRIQVVHSHEFTMAVYGAAAARRVGARHVVTMHGGRYYGERWRRRVAFRWAVRRSAALTAVSRATADDLRRTLRLGANGVQVVPNGIDAARGDRRVLRRELGLADTDLLLVAVGNLYPVKGHLVLLRALAALGDGLPPWHLAIAGRGDEEERLRRFAGEAGLASRVHLLGFRADVPDLLAAADVFVMPSLSEGLPLALVEAMHTGLPIVISDVGGVPEVVTRDAEALLVPPGEPAPLGAAIRELLPNAARRAALGAAAQRRAARDFSLTAMGDAYEAIYRGSRPEER